MGGISTDAKQHVFEIQKKPCLEVRATRPRGLGKQNDLFSPVITHIGCWEVLGLGYSFYIPPATARRSNSDER